MNIAEVIQRLQDIAESTGRWDLPVDVLNLYSSVKPSLACSVLNINSKYVVISTEEPNNDEEDLEYA